MRRISVSTRTRTIIVITLAALILLSAVYSIKSFLNPTYTEGQTELYKSIHKAQLDYRVILAPNNFFPEPSAGPGRAYLLPLTSYIETNLVYQFEGQSAAELSGNYRVVATMTGYVLKDIKGVQGTERQRVMVWEKSNELLPATPFKTQDKSFVLRQTVPVVLIDYVNFVNSLRETYRVGVDIVELVVRYHVNANTTTAEGSAETQLAPAIVIPIGEEAFMVEGNLTDQKPANITQVTSVPVPGAMMKRIIGVAVTVFLLLALLAVLKYTEAAASNKSEKELVNIINKHGSRMIELQSVLPHDLLASMLKVASFDDLIKLADETSQPILYENLTPRRHCFYVRHLETLYGYQMEVEEQFDSYLPV